MLSLPFGAGDLLAALFHPRPRSTAAETPDAHPPFVEHDPRKALRDAPRSATPGHLLGAGGRAEIFRIPE